MARYHEIADDLRARIKAGEWKVGDKLPGISALQDQYKVEKSLGTIRSAQQQLVNDGMLRTEQGVGAFVTAREPDRPVSVGTIFAEIRGLADRGLVALQDAEFAARRAKGTVTFNLLDQDCYSVLTEALRTFAADARHNVQDAPSPSAAEIFQRDARVAEQLLDDIDNALSYPIE